MTSPRILIAAGSIAATMAGIVPVITHGTAAPVQAATAGITVSSSAATSSLVVPAGAAVLHGRVYGNRPYAKRVQLTVVRASDGATLFTGSLATFHTLPVVAGTKLLVHVQKPAGSAKLRAAATLTWS